MTRLFLISSAAAAQYVRQRRLWWLTVFPRLGNLTRRTAATFSSPPGDGSARRQSACLDRFSGAVSSLSRPKGGTRVRRSPTRSTIVCWFAADLFMRRGERNAPPPRLPWPQMRPEHTCAVQHAQARTLLPLVMSVAIGRRKLRPACCIHHRRGE